MRFTMRLTRHREACSLLARNDGESLPRRGTEKEPRMLRICVGARGWTCAATFAAVVALAPIAAHAEETAPEANTAGPESMAIGAAEPGPTPATSAAPAAPRPVEDRVRELEETGNG